MSAVIEATNVTVRYGRKTAVDGASLAVQSGSVCALLGRNGSGKSSLVRALLALRRADSGSVSLFGEDAWRNRQRLMERVGVVAEEADAPPEMRVREIAAFCGRIYARWDERAFRDRLARFAIDEAARFGALSKGQKKQVTLALALAAAPELLVLDDPTLGLDVVARHSLFEEVIADLADRGITVFITTHDLTAVETIADHVAILEKARIVLNEEVETLKARFRRIRLSSPPAALAESKLVAASIRRWGSGTEAVVSNFDDLELSRLRAAADAQTVEVVPMTLEEIFLAVAGDREGAQS